MGHTERVENLKALMKQNEESLRKREEIKGMLEKQVLLGEKRAAEQTRITEAREKMLAMKMRELELQKLKLARKKREQEAKERATEDFMQQIDKQLEEMESSTGAAPPTGAVPKQKRNKSKGKGRNRSKSNTPKVMSPEPFIQDKAKNVKVMSPEPKDQQTKAKSPEPTVIASVEDSVQLESKQSETEMKKEDPKQEEINKEDLKNEKLKIDE